MAGIQMNQTIDYTSRDYSSLRSDMIQLIRSRMPQWEANNPSDFGVALVEAYAYGLDILNYYVDRVGNEAYLSTAMQRESLYSIAEMFNYLPKSAIPASVTLRFSNTSSTDVIVPEGTRCQATVTTGSGAVLKYFETNADVIVPATSGVSTQVVEVMAIEGRTYREESLGVSTGFISQQFVLPRDQVLDRTVRIITERGDRIESWSEVDDLTTHSGDERVFQVLKLTDGTSIVRFGDGYYGKIPELHSVIKADYRVGGGTGGNVAAYSITGIVEPIIYGVSVTNPAPASGGVNQESLDSIRINAARSFRARDRAVTLGDYAVVAESVSGVAAAKAVGNNGSSVTMYIVPNTDRDISISSGGTSPITTLTSEFADDVKSEMYSKSMAGVTLSVFGPAWMTVYMKMKAVCVASAYQSRVTEDIITALNTFFSFDRVSFDSIITAQALLASTVGIPGLQYLEVESLSLNPSFVPPNAEVSSAALSMNTYAPNAVPYFTSDTSLMLTLEGGIGVA